MTHSVGFGHSQGDKTANHAVQNRIEHLKNSGDYSYSNYRREVVEPKYIKQERQVDMRVGEGGRFISLNLEKSKEVAGDDQKFYHKMKDILQK